MSVESIREMLDRQPFEPFRIVTSSGESYVIRNPNLVALMKSRLFIALPDGERWTFLNYLHVTAVEAVRNGPRRNGAPRRKRRH